MSWSRLYRRTGHVFGTVLDEQKETRT